MSRNSTNYQVQRRGDFWVASIHVSGTLVRVFATDRASLDERVRKFLSGQGRALDTWRTGRYGFQR
jgi:hypothetical protein